MEIVKDKECIHCKKFFECKGKPKNTDCLYFEEDENNPRLKGESDE